MRTHSNKRRTRAIALASALALLAGLPALAGDVRLGHAIGGVCPDCDFSGRDLTGASVVGNLPRSNFSGAILADARISGNFASASFARADLTGASLQSANFVNADLSGAKLDGAHIGGANLYAVDLTGATLRDVEASWSNFSGSNFLGAKLARADLVAITAARAEFTRAELQGAALVGADLTGARFEDADLSGADLSGANAADAAFPGADLSDVKLDGAILAGADLSAATGLTAATLAPACGDTATKLPAGLTLAPCPASLNVGDAAWSTWRRSDAGFERRGGFAARGDDAAWRFAPPGARPRPPLEALLSDIDAATRAARRLAEAQGALGSAFAASHAELDLEVRDAVESARDALADVAVVELVSSDADVLAVIDAIDRMRPGIQTPEVRTALADARVDLDGVLADMTDVRAELRDAAYAGFANSIDHERARRAMRLDRELVTRQRRLDREIDARLRTLEAECERGLFDLGSASADAGATRQESRTEIEAGCASNEAELAAERERRHTELIREIDAARDNMETELSELAHQMNLMDERPE
jgi:uncharacterized protein YjbI with pentapeptide repeats